MIVRFDYVNWKNEQRPRLVFPVRVWYGRTKYHREPQWLLNAVDTVITEPRTFAMKDISNWQEYSKADTSFINCALLSVEGWELKKPDRKIVLGMFYAVPFEDNQKWIVPIAGMLYDLPNENVKDVVAHQLRVMSVAQMHLENSYAVYNFPTEYEDQDEQTSE